MLKSIEGVCRNGRIELADLPQAVRDETRVIVTFLIPGPVDLAAREIDPAQAGELRVRLATFAEDWDSEEMAIYDDAKTAKEILAILIHEMQNPVLHIIGYSDVLLKVTGPITDDQRRFIESIRNCAVNLRDLRQQHFDMLKNFIGQPNSTSKSVEE